MEHSIDREKVIKEWEAVLSRDPLDTPWDLIDDTLVLLKEQEPVKPRNVTRHGANTQIQHFCGKCNAILFHKNQKYCIECGTPPKWKDFV